MRAPRLAAALAAALALAAVPRPAAACATAPPPGVVVEIAEESAIIVWDAAAHREHFIRRASFRSTGADFGFLVPTPDKPELAEVPDRVFDQLEEATKPAVVEQRGLSGVEPTLLCGLFMLRGGTKSAMEPAGVRVLDAQRVAGYDAVVLEADSAAALAAWLAEHHYAQRPELAAWLAPYVAAKWKLTAFKIARQHDAPSLETAAVRMTFTTERPFFPYREPSDQRENLQAGVTARQRLLRVFFFGTERASGAIGPAAASWPGKTLWSDRSDPALGGALPFSVPPGAWLTMFEDRASPRPGTDDLFFAAASDRGPVKPPPVMLDRTSKVPVPLDLVAGLGLVMWMVVRRVRRSAAPGRL
jgi:hypothetical protein